MCPGEAAVHLNSHASLFLPCIVRGGLAVGVLEHSLMQPDLCASL